MTFIYNLQIAAILFFSTISHQTYTMELVKLDNNKDLQTYTIQSNDPRLEQKATLKFINYGDLTKQYNRAALETSTYFKDMLELPDVEFNSEDVAKAIPTTCQFEAFDAVYQGMEELIKADNNHIKQLNLNALYTPKTSPELIAALSLANALNVPPITKTLACRIAQQCDVTIQKNDSIETQNNYLKNYLTLEEPNLTQIILSGTTARIPTFKQLSGSECKDILGDEYEYKDILDKGMLSPLKKVKLTKDGKIKICSSRQQEDNQPSSLEETYLQYYALYQNQDFFKSNCVFSPGENHILSITGENTATFVNINNPKNTFEIKNIIWSEENSSFRKFACFNDNGTRLLIRTYDNLQDRQYIGERYEIIDTSNGKPIRTLDSHKVNNVSFCAADKLCIQYDTYSLILTNINDNKSDKMFDHITAHAFNAKKDTLVMCTRGLKETTVNIVDIAKNSITNTITLDTLLSKISIIFNKNNNDFLIYGETIDCISRVFLCNITNTNPTKLMRLVDIKKLKLNWSASGDYVVYQYIGACGHVEDAIITGYFSITNPEPTNVKFRQNRKVDINPHQDIIYLYDKEVVQIYDIKTHATIAEYTTNDFYPRNKFDRKPTDLLNPSGKLLVIPTNEKWFVVNTKTGKTVADNGWTMTHHKLSWHNEYLLVEKCDNMRIWTGVQNGFFGTVPSKEYKFDALFKPTYDNFDNKNTTNTDATIVAPSYTKYYVGGALAFASLIAAYIYYPEFFKNLRLNLSKTT